MTQAYHPPPFNAGSYGGSIPLADLTWTPRAPNPRVDPGALAVATMTAAAANAAWFSFPPSWGVSAMTAAAQIPPAPPYSPMLTSAQAAAALATWQAWPTSGWSAGTFALANAYNIALTAFVAGGGRPVVTETVASTVAWAPGIQYWPGTAVISNGAALVCTTLHVSDPSRGPNFANFVPVGLMTFSALFAGAAASALYDTLVLPNYPYNG